MPDRPPPPRELAAALHSLDGTFLVCRDLHHAWGVDHYATGANGAVTRVLLCERCGTERVDEWTLRGARVRAFYRYPDGYQLTGAGAGYDREAMRREVLQRAGVRTNRSR